MRRIHLDAVGGIAGDMFAAAMLDACPDLQSRVLADATAVLPARAGTPRLAEAPTKLRALSFGLNGPAQAGRNHGDAGHDRDADPPHGDNGSFHAMLQRIRSAPLNFGTADHAAAILTIIAEAEAAIHRVPLADVHFHEIADWDSLLDVVAAGSIVAALGEARWTVSALPRGGGLVRTRHGLLPVPAPATAAILIGFAWRDDGIDGERVTPTGAAILRHLVTVPAARPDDGRLEAVGTGAGSRKLPGVPNVLRALVFAEATDPTRERIAILGFEIDDMTGEEIAVAADRLRLVDGVVDVSIGLRLGKKSRPMQSFRLLVRPEAADSVAERCFVETSTIGLRIREEVRIVLPRRTAVAGSSDSPVGVKIVRRPDGIETAKAESDDLAGEGLAVRRRARRLAEESMTR